MPPPYERNRRSRPCQRTEADAVDRLEAAFSYAVAGNPVSQHIETIRNASKLSRFGDNATANLQLALAGIQRVCALQFDESDTFDKYDSDQPRVPAGSGRESGQWTSGSDARPSDQGHTAPSSLYHPIASADDPRGNKMARAAAKAAELNNEQWERFRDEITGQGITDYQELLRIAKEIAAGGI